MRRLSPSHLVILLLVLLPAAALFSLVTGSVPISFSSLWQLSTESASSQISAIVVHIRLPRIVLAVSVGMVLAISGAVMQGLFRNPLADPSLIGVSSGASVGAALIIVLVAGFVPGSGLEGLPLVAVGAFIGGFAATLLVYQLATSSIGTSVATMLLAGIAISALAGAFNSLLGYFADNEMLRRISLWQMGSLGGADWSRAGLMAALALLLMLLFPRYSKALNALLLGESEARHLGIDVQRVKRQLILLTALGVGVSVACAGLVAFVGLVVPHIVRLLIGPDHRALLPASALAGGLLLIIADSFARVVVSPAELPTGIVTALMGAPFFIALLVQQRREV